MSTVRESRPPGSVRGAPGDGRPYRDKIIDGRTTLPPHGSREMPVWGFEFRAHEPQRNPDELITRLTSYVRSLQIN